VASESPKAEALAFALREGFRQAAPRWRGNILNEAGTLSLLILPVLTELGYPPSHRIPQHGAGRNFIDEACFLREVGSSAGQAALIVEAKEYKTDFDSGQGRSDSPDRQLQRYLKQHDASGPGTLGVLTDGVKWRVYRRTSNPANPDLEFIVERDFSAVAQEGKAALESEEVRELLAGFYALLARERIEARLKPAAAAKAANPADSLFADIAQNRLPEYLVCAMLNDPAALVQSDLTEDVTLLGVRKDAHDTDWEAYAYAHGPALRSPSPSLAGKRAVVAAVNFRHDPVYGLPRWDTAVCARTFASVNESGAAVVLARCAAPDGSIEARLAVAAGGQVNMTAAFDPTLPSPSARAAVAKLLLLLRAGDGALTADGLLAPLEAAPLRQQFYKDVAEWTGRMQAGKDLRERQTVLRHLVRVMFAWILKEESIIPQELFERAFADANLPDLDRYHEDTLGFLFHRRLNVEPDKREPHPIRALDQALGQAPFLNGSLFAEHIDDHALDLPSAAYWSADEREPGLFTILSRYHWTMDEHRPGESEQTLDPELLSNLFERLIAPTEKGEAPLRQPQGTYYTPADVADEMVKDALAAAVKNAAPPNMSEAQLLALFDGVDAPPPELTDDQKDALADRVAELRIFDPAVGSGEFLFSALLALQRALRNLGRDADASPGRVIKEQLLGQDIHPLAVQIARLRLFIAITAARATDEPLPNLEARIVCADTLETVANHEWRPDRPRRLDAADPELIAALTAVAENRALWFDAYTEDEKQRLLGRDAELRNALRFLLQRKGEIASPELERFAESEIFAATPDPARADARLLFYENPWRGFDVVIGNPPYEALSKSMTPERIKTLGVETLKPDEQYKTWIKTLEEDKRYQTTKIKDLYPLFCEAALALANPDGGVVTLVTPLSIAFGQSEIAIRKVIKERCREISLRHYNIIPDAIFNGAPTLKGWKNRQRATIICAVLGDGETAVTSTGLQTWPTAEREGVLAQRPATRLVRLGESVDKRVSKQWIRTPTEEVARMSLAIAEQSRTVESYRLKPNGDEPKHPQRLALPQTAAYFLGCIPEGAVSPRRENAFSVEDGDALRLLMAVLNGHVGYAWWSQVGDGFHIKSVSDLGQLTVPDAWIANPEPAVALGERLIQAMPDCVTEKKNSGKVWRNVNFHLKPDLIEELDKLHIAALGLEEEPLLTHLRIMRSSSSWDFSRAWSPDSEGGGDPDDGEA